MPLLRKWVEITTRRAPAWSKGPANESPAVVEEAGRDSEGKLTISNEEVAIVMFPPQLKRLPRLHTIAGVVEETRGYHGKPCCRRDTAGPVNSWLWSKIIFEPGW
jgi:hypothetical protein